MKPARGFICARIAIGFLIVLIGSAAGAQAIWLSAEQFLSVRFSSSVAKIRPAVREQLKATFPRARSDVGPIDWRTAPFGIARGRAQMTFETPVWRPMGTAAPPTSATVAAEAYFNCTAAPDTRKLTESDVRTTEAEDTRTRASSRTDHVKAELALTYTAPSVTLDKVSLAGGLGGSAGAQWERSVQRSDQWIQRTREQRVHTNIVESTVTVPPRTMRFYEYVYQSSIERFEISGGAIIDVPIAAVFTRPAYSKWGFLPQTPARQFRYPLGLWSYYYPEAGRKIHQRAIATIQRDQVISGPTDATFPTIAQCLAARNDLTSVRTDLSALVVRAERLRRTGRSK